MILSNLYSRYSTKISLLLGIVGILIIAKWVYENKPSNISETTMTFKSKVIDIGKIRQSEKSLAVFKFKNSGNNDLIIQHVETECHCTAVEWPTEKIPPGGSGELKVYYDNHIIGFFEQPIIIWYNSIDEGVMLLFRGIVIK